MRDEPDRDRSAHASAGLPPALAALVRAHREGTAVAVRAAWRAVLAALVLGLAHVARLGTPHARLGVALALGAYAAIFLARVAWDRLTLARPARAVRRLVAPVDADLAARTLRAMGLASRAARGEKVGSPELVHLHLDRLLGRATPGLIEARVARTARVARGVGFLAAGLAIGAVAAGPMRVAEGLDVLFARHGHAPLPLPFLDGASASSHPPSYLHEPDATLFLDEGRVPVGSVITVAGAPSRPGRALVLTDGIAEVPFVSDGSGRVVARWTLMNDAELRVAARFGEVLVREPSSLRLVAIPDGPPIVEVERAPRTVKLVEEPAIEIAYRVTDDHGLRSVELVLRSGGHEERRVLSRLDGETKTDRGGTRLTSDDRFFERVYAPVEITVEARDNDPVTGPKWGKSAVVTVLPPQIGEVEATRYAAMKRVEDAFIDLLAPRIEDEPAGDAKARKAHADRESESVETALHVVDAEVSVVDGAVALPRRARVLVRKQADRLRETLAGETRATNDATHAGCRVASEEAALVGDAVLHQLDGSSTLAIAKKLVDVAREAVSGAELARGEERARGLARLDAAAGILDRGGEQLVALGPYGRDIGSVVRNDIRRIRRARAADDLRHAELAARDLLARLLKPTPSFGGGKGGRGGVESGGGGGTPEPGGSGAEDLDEIAREHAGEVSGVASDLDQGTDPEDAKKLAAEAKQHAGRVRDAAKKIPEGGPHGERAREGKDAANRMGDALERGDLGSAVEAGRRAVEALRAAEAEPATGDAAEEAKRRQAIADAREALEKELAWGEDALQEARDRAAGHAKDALKKRGDEEGRVADHARKARERGDDQGGLADDARGLLDRAEKAMRDAEHALRAGKGSEAVEKQHEAQKMLEQAREAERRANEAREGDPGDGKGPPKTSDHENGDDGVAKGSEVPDRDKDHGPEAFRRRVLEGLGRAGDSRWKDAVQRYAEGLLR